MIQAKKRSLEDLMETHEASPSSYKEGDDDQELKKIKLEKSKATTTPTSGGVFCLDVVAKIMQYLPYFQTIKLVRVSTEWMQAQPRVTKARIREKMKSGPLNKFIGSEFFKNITDLNVEAKLKVETWKKLFTRCENLTHLTVKYLQFVILGDTTHNINLSKLKSITIENYLLSGMQYAMKNPYLYNLSKVTVKNIGRSDFNHFIFQQKGITELKIQGISRSLSLRMNSITKLELKYSIAFPEDITAIFNSNNFTQLTHLSLKTKKCVIDSPPVLENKPSNLSFLEIGDFGDAFIIQVLKMKFSQLQTLTIEKIESVDALQEMENNPTLMNLKTLTINKIDESCSDELISLPENFSELEELSINQCCVTSEGMDNLLTYPYEKLKKFSLKWIPTDFLNADIGVGTSFENLSYLRLRILPNKNVANYMDMPLTMDTNLRNIKEIILKTNVKSLGVMLYGSPMDNVEKLDITLYNDESAKALIDNTSPFDRLHVIRIRYDPSNMSSTTLDALVNRFKNYNLKLYFYTP